MPISHPSPLMCAHPTTRQRAHARLRALAHLPPAPPRPAPQCTERYDDLDELVARYLEPVQQLLRDLVGHRKFRAGPWESLQV